MRTGPTPGASVISIVPSEETTLATTQYSKTPAGTLIVLPMVNHDNNQHAPNENLRLQNLWDGIELYATVMAELGKTWK